MKVALVSTGLGRVLRGFESFTESLFCALTRHAPELEVTLFQGGGRNGAGRRRVRNFHRDDAPARWLGAWRANLLEKRSFALLLYPQLLWGQFDLVHYNELVMGSTLFHLRNLFGGHFKLLYCDGGGAHPDRFRHRCDYAQILSEPRYLAAKAAEFDENRLFLLPYGVDTYQFSYAVRDKRQQARQLLGIPERGRIILTVAALDREVKRVDYVLREVAKLDGSHWLVAAGQRTQETPGIEAEANRLLPGRWRFVSWPREKVDLLYAAADVFVLASLAEGFGLVVAEAALCGLPIIVHNGPVFRWVAEGTGARHVDMSAEGALERELRAVLSGSDVKTSGRAVRERFSWERLVPRYREMYQRVVDSGPWVVPGHSRMSLTGRCSTAPR